MRKRFAGTVILSLSAGLAQAQTPAVTHDLSGKDAHWIKDLSSDCWAFNAIPNPKETVKWKGGCKGGRLSGHGTLTWYREDVILYIIDGDFVDGAATGTMRISSQNDGWYFEGSVPGKGIVVLAGGGVLAAEAIRDPSGILRIETIAK